MKIGSPLFAVGLAAAVFAPLAAGATCSANCDLAAGCTAQAITATPWTFLIPLTGAPSCANSGRRYIKSLTVSEDAGLAITVEFKQGTSGGALTATAATTNTKKDSTNANDCYLTFANVGDPGAVTDDVRATVTCPGTAACNIKYKVTYGCTLATMCTTKLSDGDGSVARAIVKDDSFPIPITGDACTGTGAKKYITSLTVSEDAGKGIAVSFKHGTTAISPTATTKDQDNGLPKGTDDCYLAYTDVGKDLTLTGDVTPTVTCIGGFPCNIRYKASYICRAPTECSVKSPDGSASTAIAAATVASPNPSFAIPVPTSAACPYGLKRFISALTVSEDAGKGIDVTFKQGTTGADITKTASNPAKDNGDPAATTCFRDFTNVGDDVVLTDDVIATVKCTDNKAACNIKYKVTYSCSAKVGTCPAIVATGQTAQNVATTAGFEVKKTTACAAGRFNYLTTLDVRGPVAVTFNNDLGAAATKQVAAGTGSPACAYYKDVMGLSATPADTIATIKCTGAAPCDMSYAATWNCSAPIVYTRTGSEGKDCVTSLSDCANRCAKSYQLVTTSVTTAATASAAASTTTTMAFKPQLVTGCTCTDVTATVSSTPATGALAANTDTKISVTVKESDNTLSIASTDSEKVCTLAYSRVSFANQFLEKPYTRTTPGTDAKCTPDAATASADDLCAFKCAAEISLTKPVTDTIRVTKAAVTGCKCGDPVDMVVDGDGATAGTDALKYKYTKADGILKVTTTTGADDAKLVCEAVYKESCSKVCTDAACGVNDIPAAGLALKNLDGCPAYTFSYPKSVIVRGLLADNDVSVKSATAVVDKTAVKCYKTYGQLGGTLTAISADFTPTVACGTDGCKAAVKTEWGCTAPKCPTVGADFSTKVTMTVPNATGMVVPGPTTACATGLKAYIKSLDIRTAANKDVVVKFNNGLTPLPSSKGATCTFYSNVISPTAATDVSATINCASTTAADTCDVQYKVEYGCFKPAAATVYTRKGAPDGRGCVTDLSTCASRCAKSYQLIATETEKMLVPQITPDGCFCPALTATTDATTTTKATNTATTMEVNDGTTMTVEYTAPGKECKTTFAKAAFANSFVAETYARGTVTPATCTPAADADAATTCAYKCAAELSIKPLAMDALNVTQAVVTTPADCTCDPFMAYVDVDGLTASGPLKTSSVEIKQTTGAVTVKTTTGTTVCTATYTKKTAPPPPATTTPSPTTTAPPPATTAKTGTSAGVSALGAGADAGMVTVTLVAAAAGVQAVGLPA